MVYKKKFQMVGTKRIAYINEGKGPPILLLHGNPTSSFLWRNVIPELSGLGEVIAPDLIGQGDSDKLPVEEGPLRYTFDVVYRYLADFLDAIGVRESVTIVAHDWGTALGFYWAQQNPDSIRAIAYMEGIVCPLDSWADWPEEAVGIFKGFRSKKGEDLILERNLFIEGVLPNSILRNLSQEEMDNYRRPFLHREDRQPMLNWPRQIPIAGEPGEMVDLVSGYAKWLLTTDELPKLFINADPGSILVGKQREYCRSWPNQVEVTVSGTHFIQEDSPVDIGRAVSSWFKTLEAD